jgi:hypothetical protein
MSSLGEELPNEIRRVTGLIEIYASLPGNVGAFAIAMMRGALDKATRAMATGDVVQMIRSYEDLKGFKE